MALNLLQPWWLVGLPVGLALLVLVSRRVRLRWLPAMPLRFLLISSLFLALAYPRDPAAPTEDTQVRTVYLVDQSLSLTAEQRRQAREAVQVSGPTTPDSFVIAFASQPILVARPAGTWPDTTAGATGTDLEKALDAGAGILGPHGGRIVLISDGLETTGQAEQAAQRLAAAGIRLEVLPLDDAIDNADVIVAAPLAPNGLWSGTPYDIVTPIYAPAAVRGDLTLSVDGTIAAEQNVDLQPGQNLVTIPQTAGEQGLIGITVSVDVQGDPMPDNNSVSVTLPIFSPPSILIVSDPPEGSESLQTTLQEAGLEVSASSPTDLPSDLAAISQFQTIMLSDIPAASLTLEQLQALKTFVSSLGRGLLVLGGRHSYILGSYAHTPLENLLPVKLEPPPRDEQLPANMLLVLDRSNSMVGRPVALAKEAAMRAVEILSDEDRLGVLVFSTEAEWLVPFQDVGSGLGLRNVLDQISRLNVRGGTRMYQALTVGLEQFALESGNPRHVILLSDGKSTDGSDAEFLSLARQAWEVQISLTTIAIGDGADTSILEEMAELGKGRFYQITDLESLPRVMVTESQAVKSDPIQLGTIRARAGVPDHPALAGLSPAELPALEGYLALTSRAEEGAEDIMVSSSFNDPLLSAWQYGLGRVIAWTSDLNGEWTPAWNGWAEAGQFWAQIIRFALPDPSLGPLQAHFVVHETTLETRVTSFQQDGKGANHARMELIYAGLGGEAIQVTLPQTAPGEYGGQFQRPVSGPYRALIRQTLGGETRELLAGFAVNYPAELALPRMDGQIELIRLAEITGGGQVSWEDLVTESSSPSTLPAGNWAWWLVLGCLVAWPLEIALRRRFLPWDQAR